MTGAALLAILTLCYVRVSLVEAVQEKEPISCVGGQKSVGKLSAPGSLTVKCNPPVDTLNPNTEANVFRTEECTGPGVALTTLIPGAAAAAAAPGRTVTVRQMPTSDVSVFYLCKKSVGEAPTDKCVVELQITAAGLLGPNTCALQDASINLEIRKVGETAEFACADEKRLFPEDVNKAFDSTCSNEVDVPAGLVRTHSQNQKYHLNLRELPKTPQKLCFFCASSPTATPKERCEVHVATTGGESGGSPAVGPRGATVVGVSLLAATWLSMN